MNVERMDHLVLHVRNVAAAREFYRDVLCMDVVSSREQQCVLRCGQQELHLFRYGGHEGLQAAAVTPGALDVCFITETPLAAWVSHLGRHGVELVLPPLPRTGAVGPIESIYVRDPDGNLIEVANYVD